MAIKPAGYAILEGIREEMLRDPNLTMLYEYESPRAVSPLGQVIDLYREFGPPRVAPPGPIDEEWFVGAAAGMSMTGVPCIARCPSMTPVRAFEFFFNQIGKLRHMMGGQANMPMVLWQGGAGRLAGMAGQHADAGQEALYASITGVKVVIPSNAYDAKGLMIAAIRDPDPVVFFDYASAIGTTRTDVPDGAYVVPIGEAAIRQEGTDITLVGYAPASIEIQRALPELSRLGISAEVIDPRSLVPLPIDPIIESVRKTGTLLVVDHGHETFATAAEIIAQTAMAVPAAKVARITFPDAPPPGSRVLIEWMTPDAPKIVDAVQKLLRS